MKRTWIIISFLIFIFIINCQNEGSEGTVETDEGIETEGITGTEMEEDFQEIQTNLEVECVDKSHYCLAVGGIYEGAQAEVGIGEIFKVDCEELDTPLNQLARDWFILTTEQVFVLILVFPAESLEEGETACYLIKLEGWATKDGGGGEMELVANTKFNWFVFNMGKL